jgi:hypothetical protein
VSLLIKKYAFIKLKIKNFIIIIFLKKEKKRRCGALRATIKGGASHLSWAGGGG